MKPINIKKLAVSVFFLLILLEVTMSPSTALIVKNTKFSPKNLFFHKPISIDKNDDFTRKNGVISGKGKIDDPYIIANWRIYSLIKPCIKISNTDAYIIIENCQVRGLNSSGIYLENVKNCKILNCSCINIRYNFGSWLNYEGCSICDINIPL